MRISEIEKVVREGFASEELRARIMVEGPVALSDVLKEIEAREAARTLTGRLTRVEGEINAQVGTAWWDD